MQARPAGVRKNACLTIHEGGRLDEGDDFWARGGWAPSVAEAVGAATCRNRGGYGGGGYGGGGGGYGGGGGGYGGGGGGGYGNSSNYDSAWN